jgi:hypothetical protein
MDRYHYNKKLEINASEFACLETNYEHILQSSSRSRIIHALQQNKKTKNVMKKIV